VRQILADLQRPLRVDRAFLAARKQGWAALRAHKVVLARELARYGLYLHGWEVRGWRNTTLFEEWPLEPQVACPTVVESVPDLSRTVADTPPGPGPTYCDAAVPAALPAGETPTPQELPGPPTSPGVFMENFALAFSVCFASPWSLGRGPYSNAMAPRRRERHRGCVCDQDRPFRRNGPIVDQRARPAVTSLPANWRNRIPLTNGPADSERLPRAPPTLASLKSRIFVGRVSRPVFSRGWPVGPGDPTYEKPCKNGPAQLQRLALQ
jgi:hypothetical protein